MNVKISESWKSVLHPEFEQPYFQELTQFVREEVKNYAVFPPGKLIFNAFEQCPFDRVKVVLIGQDPYHGAGQANGLCFSVNEGVQPPPSLVNIFKEIQNDLGKPIPSSGNLERWAQQGVLMLNATLTVREKTPGSHQNRGWEIFTDAVISAVAQQHTGIVFLLWGAYAQKKADMLDESRHCVLKAAHPSPFSVHKGFFGSKHFSKANEYLVASGKTPIDW